MGVYTCIYIFFLLNFRQNEHLPQLFFKLLFLLHHVVTFPTTRAYNLKGTKAKRCDKKGDKETIKEGKSR